MAQAQSLPRQGGSSVAPRAIASVALLVALAVATRQLVLVSPSVLEFPIWAAALGLAANLLTRALGVREQLGWAFRTELFLKIGLVLLGVSVNLSKIAAVGARGMLQAAIMIVAVFLFTWWLSGVFKLDSKLQAVLSAAVAVCGVSAAIAATGAVLARKEQLAYVSALVIAVSLPLMILLPAIAVALGLPPDWAGAWFGGNIDTTAAVVGAGAIYGPEAEEVAAIVKLSQNALMGIVAFLLALYWVVRVEGDAGQRPSVRVIWERFPKFVLGFLAASAIVSLGLLSSDHVADVNALRYWALTLAFVCIGWDISFAEFRQAGARPVVVYLTATVFNTVLAFFVAWFLFA